MEHTVKTMDDLNVNERSLKKFPEVKLILDLLPGIFLITNAKLMSMRDALSNRITWQI